MGLIALMYVQVGENSHLIAICIFILQSKVALVVGTVGTIEGSGRGAMY